jgi:hypothetical protein
MQIKAFSAVSVCESKLLSLTQNAIKFSKFAKVYYVITECGQKNLIRTLRVRSLSVHIIFFWHTPYLHQNTISLRLSVRLRFFSEHSAFS